MKYYFLLCFVLLNINSNAQEVSKKLNEINIINSPKKNILLNKVKHTINNYQSSFIENIGQYGTCFKEYEYMGEIKFGYEESDIPVLFTTNGMIFRQRHLPFETVDKDYFETDEKRKKMQQKVITLEWIGANKNIDIIMEEKTSYYNTYGMLQSKAFGYRKLIYKNIYPGIDLEYKFTKQSRIGFEYNLIVHKGAKPEMIRLKCGGDFKTVSADKMGLLQITSDIGIVRTSFPISYYLENGINNYKQKLKTVYKIKNNIISFNFPLGLLKSKSIVIDPFISSTANLTGSSTNNTIAKDIDFDYDGNIYVSGGGTNDIHKLAKYDSTGNLLWTFSGSIVIPFWEFGASYGGWVVEKNTGKIYLGQGINANTQVIRLNQLGLYDNYISAPSSNFRENWKMIWNCNNGIPEILIGGGTTLSNLNFTTLSPPSVNTTPVNITGNPGVTQDIADMVIDPINRDLYTIYSSKTTPAMNNIIFKHSYPYNVSNIVWQVPSGFNTLKEADNKPYLEITSLLPGLNTSDNNINLFAVNSSFLYYWDGKNLKAFNKNTGANAGIPLFTTLLEKQQGGIFADECNNIFIGYANGKIKVLKFDGNIFDDAAVPDIDVSGFSTRNVYDLVINTAEKLLYACGKGFVASFDISNYCTIASPYSIAVNPDCINNKATATLLPTPPAPSLVTYSLYLGTTFLSSNTTGIFTNLLDSTLYTIKATINQICSGTQPAKVSFSFPYCAPVISSNTNTTCGLSNGSITINPLYGNQPHMFSLDGINFQMQNSFSNLSSGIYLVTIKDFLGVIKTISDTIQFSLPISISYNKTEAFCNQQNGTITVFATGGSGGYSYSLDNINFQSNNIFNALASGNYIIYVKDTSNCFASIPIQINTLAPLLVQTSNNTVTCFNNDGVITVSASGGQPPYLFNINGGIFQNANVFSSIGIGSYIVGVKDALGCEVYTQPISIILGFNTVAVSVTSPISICEGKSAQIIASSNASSFSWFPTNNLTNPTVLQPLASPLATQKYYLTATTGICSKTDSVLIAVNLLPTPNAGKPDTICYGKSIQLNGSGGIEYIWSPATFLSSTIISNPVLINPNQTITYSLSVKDANGCLSVSNAQVKITVLSPAKVFAGNDTSILINEPLQLNVTDVNNLSFTQFSWSPATGLNNTQIKNPVTQLVSDIVYSVTAISDEGCIGVDDIKITVFSKADIYVPTAFTPNKDGKNDILYAVPYGIKEFNYLKIYNRYGQLVFLTNDFNYGWDGKFKGTEQSINNFIWVVRGVDYKGKVIFKNGTTILLR